MASFSSPTPPVLSLIYTIVYYLLILFSDLSYYLRFCSFALTRWKDPPHTCEIKHFSPPVLELFWPASREGFWITVITAPQFLGTSAQMAPHWSPGLLVTPWAISYILTLSSVPYSFFLDGTVAGCHYCLSNATWERPALRGKVDKLRTMMSSGSLQRVSVKTS